MAQSLRDEDFFSELFQVRCGQRMPACCSGRRWLIRVSGQIGLGNSGLNKTGPTFFLQAISESLVCSPTSKVSQKGYHIQHFPPSWYRNPLLQDILWGMNSLEHIWDTLATQKVLTKVGVYQTTQRYFSENPG